MNRPDPRFPVMWKVVEDPFRFADEDLFANCGRGPCQPSWEIGQV